MTADPYQILGVPPHANMAEIKKAFREQAKRLHPDTGRSNGDEQMRLVLLAYKTVSEIEARLRRDKKYEWVRPARPAAPFDFRAFLLEEAEAGDGEARARLIMFELFRLRGESAVFFWHKYGGLDFPLQNYFERGDWMDLTYILAEELARRGYSYEAFSLLVNLLNAEKTEPYFRHFAGDVRLFLKELVRQKLRGTVDGGTWVSCLEKMLTLGYPFCEQARWRDAIKRALAKQKPA